MKVEIQESNEPGGNLRMVLVVAEIEEAAWLKLDDTEKQEKLMYLAGEFFENIADELAEDVKIEFGPPPSLPK